MIIRNGYFQRFWIINAVNFGYFQRFWIINAVVTLRAKSALSVSFGVSFGVSFCSRLQKRFWSWKRFWPKSVSGWIGYQGSFFKCPNNSIRHLMISKHITIQANHLNVTIQVTRNEACFSRAVNFDSIF